MRNRSEREIVEVKELIEAINEDLKIQNRKKVIQEILDERKNAIQVILDDTDDSETDKDQ